MRTVPLILALVSTTACDASPKANAGVGSASARTSSVADPQPLADTPTGDDAVNEGAAEPTEGEAALGEPEELRAPEDYGAIKPSLPPPDPASLTVHALAGYEVVAVYDQPSVEAERLGYVRIGQRMMVTPPVEGTGCPKGWHHLPQGGFACASKGLLVDAERPPYMHRPPPPPKVHEPLPYDYAYVRRWNSPMFWRIPSAEELRRSEEQRATLEAAREGKSLAGAEPKPTDKSGEPSAAGEGSAPVTELPSVTDEPSTPPPAAAPGESVIAQMVAPEPEPISLPLNADNPWLEKGFFISLSEKVTEAGHTWWRTARGGYVQSAHAFQYKPKDFVGVPLGEESDFPFGFVMVKNGTKSYELSDAGKLVPGESLERRTFVDLTEETEVGGKSYMMTTDGRLLRKEDLRLGDPQPLPEGLEPYDRWIDVDLAKQMLVAYEGTRPVYVTLVSSGRKGTKEEPFDTPTGRWRIRSKHISTTMDGPTASDGNYSIQDVPWTMFFQASYALHGAFWHEGFGRVRSHGCVNLGPSDARWLFNWTTPILPEGWHGVHAHEGSPGTTIIVRAGGESPGT